MCRHRLWRREDCPLLAPVPHHQVEQPLVAGHEGKVQQSEAVSVDTVHVDVVLVLQDTPGLLHLLLLHGAAQGLPRESVGMYV